MFLDSCTLPTNHSYVCEERVSGRSKQDAAMNTPTAAPLGLLVMKYVLLLLERKKEKAKRYVTRRKELTYVLRYTLDGGARDAKIR